MRKENCLNFLFNRRVKQMREIIKVLKFNSDLRKLKHIQKERAETYN